jgi:hypothetical protein
VLQEYYEAKRKLADVHRTREEMKCDLLLMIEKAKQHQEVGLTKDSLEKLLKKFPKEWFEVNEEIMREKEGSNQQLIADSLFFSSSTSAATAAAVTGGRNGGGAGGTVSSVSPLPSPALSRSTSQSMMGLSMRGRDGERPENRERDQEREREREREDDAEGLEDFEPWKQDVYAHSPTLYSSFPTSNRTTAAQTPLPMPPPSGAGPIASQFKAYQGAEYSPPVNFDVIRLLQSSERQSHLQREYGQMAEIDGDDDDDGSYEDEDDYLLQPPGPPPPPMTVVSQL